MESIHTIPVIEALREPGLCAFCTMKKRLDDDAIKFIMGPAYMEDNVRMKTDEMGFCKKHLAAMYEEQNRLGLALMLHTHVKNLMKSIDTLASHSLKPSIFGSGADSYVAKLGEHLAQTDEDCYVCKNVESTFARFVDTYFTLWNKGGSEAQLINSQKGYCLHHFTMILHNVKKLGSKKRGKFLAEIVPTWQTFMKDLEGDLDWFIQKFDYRNKDEDWKNSKDVLIRAQAIMGGEA